MSESKPLSIRDKILAASDISSELVEVPLWGVTVEVRGMSGKDRAVYMNEFSRSDGTIDYVRLYPSLLTKTVYDPDTGERIFSDSDEELINSKSGSALEKLGRVAVRLSGLNEQAEDEVGKTSEKAEANGASTSS